MKYLELCVDETLLTSEEATFLYSKYHEQATAHNNKLTSEFPDAGFDLYVPSAQSGEKVKKTPYGVKVGHGIRCIMREDDVKDEKTGRWTAGPAASYYLYPRSSVSKTSFRLANSVGIIDSGYRGELIGMFDVVRSLDSTSSIDGVRHTYSMPMPAPLSRLCQICAGDLSPFKVIVRRLNESQVDGFVNSTERGSGGFGSTGQ